VWSVRRTAAVHDIVLMKGSLDDALQVLSRFWGPQPLAVPNTHLAYARTSRSAASDPIEPSRKLVLLREHVAGRSLVCLPPSPTTTSRRLGQTASAGKLQRQRRNVRWSKSPHPDGTEETPDNYPARDATGFCELARRTAPGTEANDGALGDTEISCGSSGRVKTPSTSQV